MKSMLIGALIVAVGVLGYLYWDSQHNTILKRLAWRSRRTDGANAMLEEAHKGLQAMSTAANAMKDEEWGGAERALMEVQEITSRLLREVGEGPREDAGASAGPQRPGLAGHTEVPGR